MFCDGPRPVADVTGTATGTDVAAEMVDGHGVILRQALAHLGFPV